MASTNQQSASNDKLDFIDILLRARDGDGKAMTSLEIRNQADTMMVAGILLISGYFYLFLIYTFYSVFLCIP